MPSPAAVVFAAAIVSLLSVADLRAQDATPRDTTSQDDATHDHSTAMHHEHDAGADATNAEEASGTAWLPAVTRMYGVHRDAGGWALMAHGNAFVQFIHESGAEHHRGQQIGSINWFMGTATRQVGRGRLALRSMISLEPWTIGGCGYPDLLATGEVCDGDTVHDRQHPHDLFMELAISYDAPLSRGLRWEVYGGPAGEPALGPAAFPHRPSALENPMAPIAHHWLDSTHVSFGVVTGAVYARRWKVEGSVFNGHEPDETRTNLDLAALSSFSGRVSFAPTAHVVLQASAGHLEGAEAGIGTQPRTDVDRATASAAYHRPLRQHGLWATTLAWGVDSEIAILPTQLLPQTTHAVLLETTATWNDADTVFGRIEIVGKPGHALHAHEYDTLVFTVGKIETGYTRYLAPRRGISVGLGGALVGSLVPELLTPRYEGRFAPGAAVFIALRPARMH